MPDLHNIDDHERELIILAIKQLRDRCTQALNWLAPPPVITPPIREESLDE